MKNRYCCEIKGVDIIVKEQWMFVRRWLCQCLFQNIITISLLTSKAKTCYLCDMWILLVPLDVMLRFSSTIQADNSKSHTYPCNNCFHISSLNFSLCSKRNGCRLLIRNGITKPCTHRVLDVHDKYNKMWILIKHFFPVVLCFIF